ncbi:MAG: hypothetical protein MZW92_17025 [Comamonadaceae bacterium]|nr:hypothetical protein [Comamonadaceae bacterium]
MSVELGDLRAVRDGTLELPGRVILSDAESADKVERLVSARFRNLRPGTPDPPGRGPRLRRPGFSPRTGKRT